MQHNNSDTVVFDFEDFEEYYPGFAEYLGPKGCKALFNQLAATDFDVTSDSPVINYNQRKGLMYLLMAHYICLGLFPLFGGYNGNTGVPMTAQQMSTAGLSIGFIRNAEQGTVREEYEIPYKQNGAFGDLNLTIFGQKFIRDTKPFRSIHTITGNAHPPWVGMFDFLGEI